MKYLLDANAVIALLNDKSSKPALRARQHKPDDIGISAIVAYALFYGAFKSKRTESNIALIDGLSFAVLEFDKEDARQAGDVRATLVSRGAPIGPYDILIAGQAKARGIIFVTNNTSEFGRVPGLQIENWEV